MKKIIGSLLIICVFCSFCIYIKAEDLNLAPNAKSTILLEASTGEVIYERNSHEKLHPASMTKMMSMLLILENIDKGVIKWDDIVTVSENASSMGGSQILLETNEQMSVYDLFKGIAVASGNDAVVAMAEKIAGTEELFVEMMNKRAQELGLSDTNFKNCHGLDDANHYSSAADMAKIALELVKHEKLFEFTSIYEDYLRDGTDRKFWLVNTNRLVRFYNGVDGLKTGYTKEAGYCLTATAKRNNMRIIAVVMGEPESSTRSAEVSAMLDYAFAQYEIETFLSTNSIIDTININKSKQEYADIIPKEDVTILNKKIDNKKTATYKLQLDDYKLPIKAGNSIGKLHVYINDKLYRQIDVTVPNDIEKANIISLYGRYLKKLLTGNIEI
ncbi:MAG: D-alanyl-D-alanine carboxypeptidase [Bacilli bacterium]|nr:D-alanyl-D-alanine carboxypeptidase [Bacilli bacterium]